MGLWRALAICRIKLGANLLCLGLLDNHYNKKLPCDKHTHKMADKDLLFVSSAAVDRENDTFISHIDDYPCNHRFFVLFFYNLLTEFDLGKWRWKVI